MVQATWSVILAPPISFFIKVEALDRPRLLADLALVISSSR